MKLGIVGLPNVGKSTLFNAITNAGAESANYPFCTIEPNVGVVSVPDSRLETLRKMYDPVKVTPAVVEFVDIAGLVRGASKGEGLGNKFLSHIREVDAIVHVVRCFEGTDVIHVEGSVDPLRDVETVETELILSDIEAVDRRLGKVRKTMKGDRSATREATLLERVEKWLSDGKPARTLSLTDDENELLRTSVSLLTEKPVIYVANLSEDDFRGGVEKNVHYQHLRTLAESEGAACLPICAKLEEELSDMGPDDKKLFLADLGLKESGLDRLIRASYRLLGLISFLTAGKPEVRAWTIKNGTKAPQAAGKIHSDFERGFIRAEVVPFDKLVACGGLPQAREKGLVRSEGKDYVMQDGDVVLFRFNV